MYPNSVEAFLSVILSEGRRQPNGVEKTPLLFRSPEKLITISTTGAMTRIVATPEAAKKVFSTPAVFPALKPPLMSQHLRRG
jgi:hypothetical protein